MKSFKNCIKIFVSLLLIACWPQPAQNCGFDGYGDDARVWILLPTISNIPGLFENNYSLERRNGYYDNPSWYNINVIEWQEIVGPHAKPEDIYSILYRTYPENYFGKTYPAGNTFMTSLTSPDLKEVKAYLDFAKICESLTSEANYYREDNWKKEGFPDLETAVSFGEQFLENTNDAWVKLRLAYKLSRLYDHLKEYDKMEEVIKQYIAQSEYSESWIVGSSKIDKIEATAQDAAQRSYWLSLAYLTTPSEKDRILKRFDEGTRTSIMEMAQNREEKAVVEFLYQIKNPGRTLEGMEYIHRFKPNFAELRFLLAKEINKIEDWIFSPILLDNNIYQYASYETDDVEAFRTTEDNRKERLIADMAYVGKLRKFIDKVIEAGTQPDLYFWKITGAYLAFIQSDFTRSRILLDKVGEIDDLPKNIQLQYKTTEALVSIFDGEHLTEKCRFYIYELFQFIDEAPLEEVREFKSEVALLLSNCLISRGYRPEGVLLLTNNLKPFDQFTYSMSKNLYHRMLDIFEPADYTKTLQILSDPQSPFEKWLQETPEVYPSYWRYEYDAYEEEDLEGGEPTEENPEEEVVMTPKKKKIAWNLDQIRDYQATSLLIAGRLEEAVATLEKIPERYFNSGSRSYYLQGNPFALGLIEQSSLGFPADQPLNFSKLTLVKKMLELNEKIKASNGKDQQSLFLMANAYYSMSYYGDWWLATFPAKSRGLAEKVYSPYPKVKKKESLGSRLPIDIFWGLGMMGFILIGFGVRKRNPYLSGLTALGLVTVFAFYWSGCNSNSGEKAIFDLPLAKVEANRTMNSFYFEAEKALEYYQKTNAIDPDSELGIASAYMLEQTEKRKKVFLDDLGVAYEASGEIKMSENKNFNTSISCLTFGNYLIRNGYRFTAITPPE